MNTDTLRAVGRQTAVHFARHTLVLLALVTVYLFAVSNSNESVDRPHATGSAAALMADNGCSDTVDNPTHVVVTTADGVTRYGGQRLTDRAIEQVMFGMDHGLTVHGFCR